MRIRKVIILCLSFILLACQFVTVPFTGGKLSGQTPTSGVTPTPSRTAPPVQYKITPFTPTSIATKASEPFEVQFHPDGGLYVGDKVSMEVIAPPGTNIDKLKVSVNVDPPDGASLGPVKFGYFGLGRRPEATLYWNWDTGGLKTGVHELTFSVSPSGAHWTQSVTLLPASQLPPPEPEAHWATTESDCCNIFYITGTAAERDLPELLSMIDQQAQDVDQKFNYALNQPIPIELVPRVLGHGGFTAQQVAVSYLDRNYTAAPADIILHHEMVHLVDGRLGGEWRPSLFIEGLAVYLSGGHFKPEPLIPRAAALIDLGWYIPLESLMDDFYINQHEIGYLEAGALVEFMVKTWGWQAFSDFYRDMKPPAQGQDALGSLNLAMLKHFQLPLAGVEARFLDYLQQETLTDENREDVRETVNFFDAVRRYQELYDPSAYYLTAWMVDGKQMRERRIVADYLRHPSRDENLTLETMLNAAGESLQGGDYVAVRDRLAAVNATLDAAASKANAPFSYDPLATDYYRIVQALSGMGFEAQKIEVNGDQAQAWVTQGSSDLLKIELERLDNAWTVIQSGG
jgi:hypothetical protein